MARLETQASSLKFWDDPQAAQPAMIRLAELKDAVDTWRALEKRVASTYDLLLLALEEGDSSLGETLAQDADAIARELKEREFQLTLSGEYDRRNAILAIHAGAGGTESQDWAQMLLRMYLRWAERRGYDATILDLSPGDEAGVKSVVLNVVGRHAYGYLKADAGVHRLVRLSPFDSAHMRHTSFALVEVLPEAEEQVDVTINPDDIRVDVFRASGHGGQAVQKNATAVRITHVPTGIVVSCQNERSQFQNKEYAMKVLRARLMELEMKRQAEEQARLKGEHVSAEWGNQIRSYVLHPYRMVKDHRTGYETSDTTGVLDGDLDPLLQSYLLHKVGREG
ncbi:MAG: peptide chain release factor 2 [Chloroflexi bacterium]|nr:peptide chain release factor 2 [Chloroflexota bacterium]